MVLRCLFSATQMSRQPPAARISTRCTTFENISQLENKKNTTVWWGWDGQSLTGYNLDGDNGGRLRAAAASRGQPRANCKKKKQKKLVPYHTYRTVPSSSTIPEPYRTVPVPYRISFDLESIKYCNNNPHTYMHST